MSRSYKKNVKVFIACGNNTTFYKNRRRNIRRKNKNNLRYLIANKPIDEVNDLILNDVTPKENQWLEPTDGHYKINKEIIKQKDRINDPSAEYFHKKYDKYFKRIPKP